MIKSMGKVDDNKKTPAERIQDVKPRTDGPHKSMRKEKKEVAPKDEAAYTVSLTKVRPSRHQAEDAKAKARELLKSNQLSSQERKVLAEILGPDKDS
jgi:hypothetical protein